MAKRVRKTSKVRSFIQDWGTYSNQTLVVVGMNHKQIIAKMKQMHLNKEIIQEFDKSGKDKDDIELIKGANAFCWLDEHGRSVLSFVKWDGSWVDYDTLVHETYHLVYSILHKHKNMKKEEEACAYQMEYLFRNIRKKLNR